MISDGLSRAYFLSPGASALRWRFRAIREAVADWSSVVGSGSGTGWRVIDIGGGDGALVKGGLAGRWAGVYTLVESDAAAIAAADSAARGLNVETVGCDASLDGGGNLPAAILAVASGVLELMDDGAASAVLSAAATSLRRGQRSVSKPVPGGLLLSTMAWHPHAGLVRRCVAHDRRLGRSASGPAFRTPIQMEALLRKSGFNGETLWRSDPRGIAWVGWSELRPDDDRDRASVRAG
ncbi:MAG: hypothetical protein AAGE65_13880 [Planctomycetota bacterium]